MVLLFSQIRRGSFDGRCKQSNRARISHNSHLLSLGGQSARMHRQRVFRFSWSYGERFGFTR